MGFLPKEMTQNKPSPLFEGWNWEAEGRKPHDQKPQHKALSFSDTDSSPPVSDGGMHLIYSRKSQINRHFLPHHLSLEIAHGGILHLFPWHRG